jgi:hypothetical protein
MLQIKNISQFLKRLLLDSFLSELFINDLSPSVNSISSFISFVDDTGIIITGRCKLSCRVIKKYLYS